MAIGVSVNTSTVYTFGIVAAEHSGDILGARLITQLKVRYPNARFIGIGGEQMCAHSEFICLYDMNEITAIGVTQVLAVYWRARKVLFALLEAFQTRHKIDCFIAIDAPMFNMPLARKLKPVLPTVLYVSPAYWSFLPRRMFRVMQDFSAVLCLYPFEVKDYHTYGFPAYYVGHPVLDTCQLRLDAAQARTQLGIQLPEGISLLCCFLGSRAREVRTHAPYIAQTLTLLRKTQPTRWHIVLALPSVMKQAFMPFESLFTANDVSIVYDESALCLSACDTVLVKSGTSTLEALVAEKPMVIYYYAPWITRIIFRFFCGGRFFGLPNFLCRLPSVPELVSPTAKQLLDALVALNDPQTYHTQKQSLVDAHQQLKQTTTATDEAIACIVER